MSGSYFLVPLLPKVCPQTTEYPPLTDREQYVRPRDPLHHLRPGIVPHGRAYTARRLTIAKCAVSDFMLVLQEVDGVDVGRRESSQQAGRSAKEGARSTYSKMKDVTFSAKPRKMWPSMQSSQRNMADALAPDC